MTPPCTSVAVLIAALLSVTLHAIPARCGSRNYDVGALVNEPHPFASVPGSSGGRPADARGPAPRMPSGIAAQPAGDMTNGTGRDANGALTKEQKALILNAAAVTGVLTYGIFKWDYFQTSWKSTPEGWFERTTKSGGADKMGHLWFTYAMSHLFAHVYEEWGYAAPAANGLGALSGLGVQTIMELGDGFSGDYGFSYKDLAMNVAGAGAAYLLGGSPSLKRKLDLRIEYKPDSLGDITGDIVTDYDHLRYLAALKLDGFDRFRDSPLGYLELHMGYFTRGYENFRPTGPDPRRRSIYFGIGLNVTRLIQEATDTKFALFNYLQLPYSSIRTDVGLD